MKICKKCKQKKFGSEFYTYRKHVCKKCVVARTVQWQKDNPKKHNRNRRRYYANNKERIDTWSKAHRLKKYEWLSKYKQAHPCEICGESDHRCLEFHHIHGRNKDEMTITMMINYSHERFEKEVEKCQILCANCHCIVHYEKRSSHREVDTQGVPGGGRVCLDERKPLLI